MRLFSIPENGLKSRIFITAGRDPRKAIIAGAAFQAAEWRRSYAGCASLACGYENLALSGCYASKKF
jgi:hypothetical protein